METVNSPILHIYRPKGNSTILKSPDPLDVVMSFVGLLLTLFRIVDLETINGLMPATREIMMLSRLLIVPGAEHEVQIIGVDLCLLVLRPTQTKLFIGSTVDPCRSTGVYCRSDEKFCLGRGSMVPQGSHIMKAPGIL